MKLRYLTLLFLNLIFLGSAGFAQSKGMTFQAVIRDPQNKLLSVAGVTINAKVLAPNGCILREEKFTNVDIVNGYVSLAITKGVPTGDDPGFSIAKVFDNSAPISGLVCINADGSVNSGTVLYTPVASDARKLRMSLDNAGDHIVADFNMRAVAFAVNAENLNGKTDQDFIAVNSAKNLDQTNLESIFNRFTKLDEILNNYNAISGTLSTNISGNAATATSLSGTLPISGGGTGATTAAAARTNLGTAASGANSDITSMSVVTTVGSSGALSLNAGGANQNVTVTPSGTGFTILNGKVGVGVSSPSLALEVNGAGKVQQLQITDTSATEGAACVDGTIGRDSSGNIYICN